MCYYSIKGEFCKKLHFYFLFSQVIDISQIDTKLDNFEVLYYKDSDSKLDAQYIEMIDFRDRVDNRFTFGYLDHPIWFKLNLHNDSSEKKEIILTLHEPFYDEVEIFYEESYSLVSQKSGVQVELSQRQIKHPSTHFKLSLAPYETKTYYIKLRVNFSTFGEIFLYDTQYYYETIHYDAFVYLLYLGAVLAISFYNLFLFFYLKKRVYLYYFVYSFCFGMWAGALFGGVGFYVVPIGWNYPLHIIASVSLICFILFSNEVLQVQSRYPKVFFFLQINIFFLIIVGFIIPFNIALGFMTVNTVSSYLFLLFLFISSQQVYEGDKVARLYLIAIGIFLITMSLLSFMAMGLLPNTQILKIKIKSI